MQDPQPQAPAGGPEHPGLVPLGSTGARDRDTDRPGYVPVLPLPEEPILSSSLVLGLLLGAAVLAALLYAGTRPPTVDEETVNPIVEFVILEPEPPPEPEPPAPEPPKVVDMRAPREPPPTSTAAEPPPPDAPPPKPVFGVSMNSTVQGNSGLSVRVGNTIGVRPTDEFVPPDQVQPLRQVSFSKLEEPPKLVKDFAYAQSDYPADALADGVEGTVVLKLTIDDTGKVTEVKVLRGVHPELDRLARDAAFRFTFKPGRSGGVAVVTTGYIHRYNWVIVD